MLTNNSLVNLNLGCNQISTDGAIALFDCLKKQTSIVSLSLANTDCYKNKNKYEFYLLFFNRIGTKAAIALGELLQENGLLQFLDLSDNSISSEGFSYIMKGLRECHNLISLNLTQNDLGSSPNSF